MKAFVVRALIAGSLLFLIGCTPDSGGAGSDTGGFPEPSRFQQLDEVQGIHREALQDAY